MALPAKKKESHKGLSGDVELFGLPNLLQSLSESNVTGTLTLRNPEEQVIATICLCDGKIHACQRGTLQGESAFYQLFETPSPGSFVFEPDDGTVGTSSEAPLMDVQSGLLEALRRYDELQQAKALVPDEAVLKPTGKKPTTMEDESDVAFLRNVWAKASSGAPPSTCETAFGADSYRVRRLYAHWLESGALQPC